MADMREKQGRKEKGEDMSVKIDNVTVRFQKDVKVLDDISFTIPSGVYGLLGENGAGKTTLMRVLATLLKPSAGDVMINNMVYRESNYPFIQKKIGYLPQELSLYPNLTVRECLEYLGELSGIPKGECRQRVDHYLKMTSLEEHQKKKMKHLSGGMKRRVGLIQALLNEPEFLIVDEPTTGLDPEERIRIRNLLVEFAVGRTVLFSTHVVEDLAATCSRLTVLKKGKMLYSGSVKDLLKLAEGHVWICETQEEQQVRLLEQKYHVSSKQIQEDGMTVRVISPVKPDVPCSQAKVTLEDAYIYVSNF